MGSCSHVVFGHKSRVLPTVSDDEVGTLPGEQARRARPSRRPSSLAALLTLVVLAGACLGGPDEAGIAGGGADQITVGSFDFTESAILAEIYAQALTLRGYRVERALQVGPRELVEPSLEEGLIDLVPEYLGSALGFLTDGVEVASFDVGATHRALAREFSARGIAVLEPAPVQNTNGVAVTAETAHRHGLATISDLTPLASDLTIGGPPECPERPLCLPGLEETYGLRFQEFIPTDASGPLTAGFLDAGEVDVAVLFTTSGYLAEGEYVLLEDDLGLQPPENVVPVVRLDVLSRYGPTLRVLLDSISRELETDDVIALNRSVDLGDEDPRSAALEWLRSHGFAT